jgi:hypothetical protein
MCACLSFLQEEQFRILPALQTVVHVQTNREDQSQIYLSQKLCICQKCIKPFALYGHQLAVLLKFVLSLFFFVESEFPSLLIERVCVFWFRAACIGLCLVGCFFFFNKVFESFLFYVTLQEKFDTVTVGVENVWVGDWPEDDDIQLVGKNKD